MSIDRNLFLIAGPRAPFDLHADLAVQIADDLMIGLHANTLNQVTDAWRGIVSVMVATSGNGGSGSASARTRFASTRAMSSLLAATCAGVSPPTSAMTAGPPPSKGMWVDGMPARRTHVAVAVP